jgi:hypothetical protein
MCSSTINPVSRSRSRVLLILSCVVVGASLSGCARSVFRPDDDRTPFDRYNRSRSQQPVPFLEDEYGRRTPNLRGRLLRATE